MKESYNQPNLSNEEKLKEYAKKKAIEAVKNSKVSIVNAEHLAEMEARDAADAYMTESKGQAGFWKKLIKHTFLDEYHRQKELAKVRNQISKSENIYTAVEQDRKAHEGAMQAITTRFTSEYDEAINKDAGEDREKLEEKNFGTMEVKSKVRRLISDYAQTNMSEEIFKVEKKKIIDNISDHELLKGANTYADNLFEIAKNARLAIEHGAKLEELDLDFDIIVGKAKSSIKTEAKHSWADTAVDKLKKTQIGRFVNPATLSTAVGIAYTAVTATGKIGTMFGKSKVAAYTTFGATAVVSGVLAGMNESQRLAEERRQHGRETAKGAKIEGDSPRRESMEKYAYQTDSANNLTKNLRESLFTKDVHGKEIPKDISESELATVLHNITNIEARESLAQSKKIDLVTYSHPGQVEKEKTELVILLARAKVEARKQLESKFSHLLAKGETFDTYLNKQTEMTKRAFLEGEKGIDSRDKAFKWLKARRFGLVASKTILIGVTVGALAQELVAGVDGLWGGQREGVVEGIIHQVKGENTANQIQTPLNNVREWLTGSPSHIGANGIDQLIGENHFNLPEGANITPNGDGTYDINIGDREVADNIPLTFENGALDQASIDRLGEAGIVANTCTNVIENAGVTEVNAQDYIDQHPDATHEIKRIGWHDNDTPAPTFDQNELKMHWGGENGTGVNSNGDYVFNVSHMTSGGSFHENLSVDAQEKIKNGGLKVLLAFTRETQNHVVEGIVDTNGNVTFDHTDPVIQELFHVDDKGHAIYDGRFAEVAETFGNNSKGAEMVRLLATHEGLGNDCITVPGPKDIPVNILDLPLDDEPPYFIPFAPRTPLEPIFYKPPIKPNDPVAKRTMDLIQTYYNGSNVNEIEKKFKERSIPLDPYKMIILKDGKKIWIDKNDKEISRDAVRERARFIEYFKKQDANYLKELGVFNKNLEPMSSECRVAVIIPARFEAKNLKNLLDQYVKQVDEKGKPINKNLFEINIIVNKKEGEQSDGSVEVINKWKAENPGYHVNVIDKEFSKENANVGMARKYITDLSLLRSTERQSSSGPLYIESEDADLTSVDKRTISKLIKGFDEKPYLDVLRGIQDRQPEIMSKNDLFFFERRIWDIGEMAMRDMSLRSDKFDKSSFVWNRVISGGWNTAYTAEAYAQIGGYVPDTIGEDMKIGQKISILRGSADKDSKYKVNTYTAETSGLRANSSPRRFLDAMIKNESPYDNFDDQSVKEKNITELLDALKDFESISPEHRERYESGINTLFRFIREQMGDGEEARQIMKRTMFYMGLKEGSDKGFVIDNYKEVKITDKGYGQIGELLANYKKDKKWELGYKRQNHPLDKSIPDKTLPPIPPTEEVEKPEIPPIKKTTMISKPIKVKRDTLKPVIKQTAVKIVKPKIEAKKVVTAIKNVLPTDESKASGEYKADVERKIKARDARNAQKNK